MKKANMFHVQGMWFKSLDLKMSPPREAGCHGISRKRPLPPKNGPEKPQSKLLKTIVMRCYK